MNRITSDSSLSIISYGVKVGIRADSGAVIAALSALLPPGWKHSASRKVDRVYSLITEARNKARRNPQRLSVLCVDGSPMAQSRDLKDLFETFEADLQLYVAEFARRRLFIHSGVVGWRAKAIMIPGRSFSGKSTLVAALVRAGAVFYSDEYAVLDDSGRVHPFPKPLALRREGSFEQTKFQIESIGGRTGRCALPVGTIIVSKYKAGANWRPASLSPGKGILELLSNAVPARNRPGAALRTLRKVVSRAPVLKGLRGGADETAALILRRIDESF